MSDAGYALCRAVKDEKKASGNIVEGNLSCKRHDRNGRSVFIIETKFMLYLTGIEGAILFPVFIRKIPIM